MTFAAEAHIARELLKFADTGQLYRGSKPVMWSVVEKTALAEAEVEYEDYTSDTIWVKFPVVTGPTIPDSLHGASIVIWTTTPWTIPGNRAICYSARGLTTGCTKSPRDRRKGLNWARPGDLPDPGRCAGGRK